MARFSEMPAFDCRSSMSDSRLAMVILLFRSKGIVGGELVEDAVNLFEFPWVLQFMQRKPDFGVGTTALDISRDTTRDVFMALQMNQFKSSDG
jgi:hypothetical protein